ncbi:Homeodomain-like protein, partial [Martensiomyces pterosporus]
KHRRRTTKEQLLILESTFKTSPKPSSDVRKSLAGQLGMSAREVQIWFQNRRAKQK